MAKSPLEREQQAKDKTQQRAMREAEQRLDNLTAEELLEIMRGHNEPQGGDNGPQSSPDGEDDTDAPQPSQPPSRATVDLPPTASDAGTPTPERLGQTDNRHNEELLEVMKTILFELQQLPNQIYDRFVEDS